MDTLVKELAPVFAAGFAVQQRCSSFRRETNHRKAGSTAASPGNVRRLPRLENLLFGGGRMNRLVC